MEVLPEFLAAILVGVGQEEGINIQMPVGGGLQTLGSVALIVFD